MPIPVVLSARDQCRRKGLVSSRAELGKVMSANPYPDEPNPKHVHSVFLLGDPDEGTRRRS